MARGPWTQGVVLERPPDRRTARVGYFRTRLWAEWSERSRNKEISWQTINAKGCPTFTGERVPWDDPEALRVFLDGSDPKKPAEWPFADPDDLYDACFAAHQLVERSMQRLRIDNDKMWALRHVGWQHHLRGVDPERLLEQLPQTVWRERFTILDRMPGYWLGRLHFEAGAIDGH